MRSWELSIFTRFVLCIAHPAPHSPAPPPQVPSDFGSMPFHGRTGRLSLTAPRSARPLPTVPTRWWTVEKAT